MDLDVPSDQQTHGAASPCRAAVASQQSADQLRAAWTVEDEEALEELAAKTEPYGTAGISCNSGQDLQCWRALGTAEKEALFLNCLGPPGKAGTALAGLGISGMLAARKRYFWACACAHYGFCTLPHSTRVLKPGRSPQAPRACARALAALARAHA